MAQRPIASRYLESETCPNCGNELTKILVHAPGSPLCDAIKELKQSYQNKIIYLIGEPGSGKNKFAEAIKAYAEQESKRTMILEVMNMAEKNLDVLSASLFGTHKDGYMNLKYQTGAINLAAGGYLLLDEFHHTALPIQRKLLQPFDTGAPLFKSLGVDKHVPPKCKFIIAVNKNVPRLIEEGKFELDLYHRITMSPICIPFLKDRMDDIPLILMSFLMENEDLIEKECPDFEYTSDGLDTLKQLKYPESLRTLNTLAMKLGNNYKKGNGKLLISKQLIEKVLNVKNKLADFSSALDTLNEQTTSTSTEQTESAIKPIADTPMKSIANTNGTVEEQSTELSGTALLINTILSKNGESFDVIAEALIELDKEQQLKNPGYESLALRGARQIYCLLKEKKLKVAGKKWDVEIADELKEKERYEAAKKAAKNSDSKNHKIESAPSPVLKRCNAISTNIRKLMHKRIEREANKNQPARLPPKNNQSQAELAVLKVIQHAQPLASVIDQFPFTDIDEALGKLRSELHSQYSVASVTAMIAYLMYGQEQQLNEAIAGVDLYNSIHCLGNIDDWEGSNRADQVCMLRQKLVDQLQNEMQYISSLPISRLNSSFSHDTPSRPQHGLWVDRKPLTQKDFYRFTQATGQLPTNEIINGKLDIAVTHIDEQMVRRFAAWAGKSPMTASQHQELMHDAHDQAFTNTTVSSELDEQVHYFFIEDVRPRNWS